MAPSIECLLAEPGLFGDGPPQWSMGDYDAPCSTAAEADAARDIFLRFCRRWREAYPELGPIGLKIAGCKDEYPCTCGACPRCQRAIQRLFVRQVSRLVGPKGYLYCTIVPTKLDPATKRGKDTSDFHIARRWLRSHLREAGIEFVLGFWDFSFNGSVASGYRLSPHFHGFLSEVEFRQAEKVFRSLHPRTARTNRPIFAPDYDGDLSAAGYAAKSKFELRKGYVTTRGDGGDAPAAMMRQTRMDDPLAAQRAELAILLDRIGLRDRLFLRGVNFAVGIDGVRLVRSTPPPLAT